MDILDLVADYTSQGLAIFPCRGKTPLIPGGFKAASTDASKVREWWTRWPDANIGMATGAASGFSILDVDVKHGVNGWDTLRALESQHGPLPATRTSLTPSGGAHLWFAHSEGWRCTTSRLGPGLDTRGDGGYVVIPPSKGLTTGTYEWKDAAVDFAVAPQWVLDGIAKRGPGRPSLPTETKTATTRKRKGLDGLCDDIHNAPDGTKNNALNAAAFTAGRMAKAGEFSADYAIAALTAAAISAGYDPAKVSEITPRAFADGQAAAAQVETQVTAYNDSHAVVLVSGKCRVIKEAPAANGRIDLDFLTPEDFANFYSNRIAWNVTANGRPQKVYLAREWLESQDRKTYHGLTFAPSGKCPPTLYNMFRGFGIEPAPGDWSLMRAHILEVICGGDQKLYTWLEAWLARIVQDPGGERPGTAVVLKGGQGTGKGMFVSHFGKIIGPHYVHLTHQEQLTSKFNSQLKDALVVFADEACYPGDKAAVGRLKGLVTEHTITIEPKGVNAFSVANHVNLLMASNEAWVIPADWDDRRFLVLEVATTRKQDHAYFQALKAQMEDGGLSAWLHHLLTVDTEAVNLHQPPRTEARAAQIVAGLPLPESYWYECVQDGQVKLADADGRDTTQAGWPPEVDKDALFNGFVDFCGQRRVRHVPTRSWFFRRLVEHGVVPAYSRDPGTRKMTIPELEAARARWVSVLGSAAPTEELAPF